MQTIAEATHELHLPIGQYVVVGGGAMAARGLRDYDDIDLLLTPKLYEQLKSDGWEEREKTDGHYHIYYENAEAASSFAHIPNCSLVADDVIANAELIDGIPFMTLDDLTTLKRAMGREKDQRDIALINSYRKKKLQAKNGF